MNRQKKKLQQLFKAKAKKSQRQIGAEKQR